MTLRKPEEEGRQVSAWRGKGCKGGRLGAQLSRRGRPLHPTHLHSPGFLRRTDFGTTMCAKC